MAEEEEVHAAIICVNAATIVQIERRRNEVMKEQMDLEKDIREILIEFENNANKLFLETVPLACLLSCFDSYYTVFLLWLSIFPLDVGQLWISSVSAKERLRSLNNRKKFLVRQQKNLALYAARELATLGDEEIGDAVIMLTSFVATPHSTSALVDPHRRINCFLLGKIIQWFLLLLLPSLVPLTIKAFW